MERPRGVMRIWHFFNDRPILFFFPIKSFLQTAKQPFLNFLLQSLSERLQQQQQQHLFKHDKNYSEADVVVYLRS